jgi:phage terminase small subunit
MTEKQKRFAEEYMKTGNSRQAYINAGYSGTERSIDVNASRLLNSDKVQEYIHQISDEIKSKKIADIEELQIRLTNIIRGLTTEEVIVTELIGNGMSKSKVLKKKPSLKDVIKACELLGRITGAYSNNNILNVVMPVYSGEDELE